MYTPRVSTLAKRVQNATSSSKKSSEIIRSSAVNSSVGAANSFTNKSLHSSHIFEETANHIVEGYGVSLPVLVAEAITMLPDRGPSVSVTLSEYGWAWLVTGRRLFVWKYVQPTTFQSKTSVTQCRELTLPSSDLAHKADLVTVLPVNNSQKFTFGSDTSTLPAAMVVSPEGLIRYWPTIAHEGSYIEISTDLRGQECFSLTPVQYIGCILATTTSTLILISVSNSNTDGSGQNNIECRNLRLPQGMLAGISRKVSSFIFGTVPSQAVLTESRLTKVLCGPSTFGDGKDGAEGCKFNVLSGTVLQTWFLFFDQRPEQLVSEIDLCRIVRESFLYEIWGKDALNDCNEIKMWMIDMHTYRDGVIILTGSMNHGVSSLIHYGLGYIDMSTDTSARSFAQFNIINYHQVNHQYHNEDSTSMLAQRFRLLIPSSTSSDSSSNVPAIYMYKRDIILNISRPQEPVQIEFKSVTDRILGSGFQKNLSLFFINSKGIVSLTSMECDASLSQTGFMTINSSNIVNDCTLSDVSYLHKLKLQNSTSSADDVDIDDDMLKLKSALILYCKQETKECKEILSGLFSESLIDNSTANLDKAVYNLSLTMINDFPASDPRWAESMNQQQSSDVSAGSLIILHQLEDKQKAHEFLIRFFADMGLMSRLKYVKIGDTQFYTKQLLLENAEKLIAAVNLRTLHTQQLIEMIDCAISKVLNGKQSHVSSCNGKLTKQDLFYRQVSDVHKIIPALLEYQTEMIESSKIVDDVVKIVSAVNKILQVMLQSVIKYRQTEIATFIDGHSRINKTNSAEANGELICPGWICTEGSNGIRTSLIKQHCLTVDPAIKTAEDVQTRGLLYQQLVDISDIILDGYTKEIESVKHKVVVKQQGDSSSSLDQLISKYVKEKKRLISPLLNLEQYDRAAALAEKYEDFEILVIICEQTDNQERLQRYMSQFCEQGFSEFVFKWYLAEGKRGKLLKQSFGRHNSDLSNFLERHPTLLWIHQLQMENYVQMQETLKSIALNDREYLSRKKTSLSLSKLAAFVSGNEDAETVIDDVNKEQELILHQETLPASVLEAYGMDVDNMRVLSLSELIQLYVSKENSCANEYDFKKALDLVNVLMCNKQHAKLKQFSADDDDLMNLRTHVFAQALLRDNWLDRDTTSPLESIKDTVFFRTIKLIFTSGLSVFEFVPPLETLLKCQELSDMAEDSNVKFLIQAAYEHIRQFIDVSDI